MTSAYLLLLSHGPSPGAELTNPHLTHPFSRVHTPVAGIHTPRKRYPETVERSDLLLRGKQGTKLARPLGSAFVFPFIALVLQRPQSGFRPYALHNRHVR